MIGSQFLSGDEDIIRAAIAKAQRSD
jgi:hypothetical protein